MSLKDELNAIGLDPEKIKGAPKVRLTKDYCKEALAAFVKEHGRYPGSRPKKGEEETKMTHYEKGVSYWKIR